MTLLLLDVQPKPWLKLHQVGADALFVGTWGPGPFDNDSAMDMAGEWLIHLIKVVHEFMAEPEDERIDGLFDPAFAAVTVVSDLMERTGTKVWDSQTKSPLDPTPIVTAMSECFGHIDELDPDPEYKRVRQELLTAELARFTRLLTD